MDYQQTTQTILTHLGFTDSQIEVNQQPDNVVISITLPEDQSGMLIGYHGEKIDALQLVLNLMTNPASQDFVPVQVDINNYRSRRQQTLEDLADKAREKAMESGREILLPSLPANERRLIHLHLQDNPDVSTYSEGEGNNRRVVVRPNIPGEESALSAEPETPADTE